MSCFHELRLPTLIRREQTRFGALASFAWSGPGLPGLFVAVYAAE